MKLASTLLGLLWAVTPLSASPVPQGGGGQSSGTGPFSPAYYTTIPALSQHTVYLPRNVPSGARLPILLWGNGACSNNGLDFQGFLTQIASHGIFVISSGTPGGRGQTSAALMTRGIDWVFSQEAKQRYPFLETSRIAVAGMSCGGVEAYNAGANDNRVSTIGIFNSGLLSVQDSERIARNLRKPTFFFMGGQSDIAYGNVSISPFSMVLSGGERDYSYLPAGTPSWKGNLDVGHGGTYGDRDGGKFGVAAVAYFDWLLRGNAQASAFFIEGTQARQAGWKVEHKNLQNIKVTPI
ncbi:hypothetical protein QBC38DRAFT_361268 [Podospora fimiseda]|uniref:Uncharacterized protein n=1 Tax=Podospora fimiseda TaxID=252190 RepID=A0AAN7BSL9_9PEZI|nr:hypothetical protein QBC38DRAFT_361268 [Podospora fimiseda]